MRETISAGEVNKYTYCPYQWYYGRIHGDKALRAKYRELHPGTDDTKAFRQGKAFHRRFGRYEGLKRGLAWASVIAALGLLLFIVLRYII
ncbi:MAG: hypothetical protein LBS19_11795 [Clostridiales bacterium]|jgi:hypothetical protein|nr:hypothetical protein [Clostridiales bacterium]